MTQTPHGRSGPDSYKRAYWNYVEKAERLEFAANALAERLKAKFAFDSVGRPRSPSDIDRLIGEDSIWKQHVGDQQFAERHAIMYGYGYIVEALGELYTIQRRTIEVLQKLSNQLLADKPRSGPLE